MGLKSPRNHLSNCWLDRYLDSYHYRCLHPKISLRSEKEFFCGFLVVDFIGRELVIRNRFSGCAGIRPLKAA